MQMVYSYVAYTSEKKIIQGNITADDEVNARKLLSVSGYQVLSIKEKSSFINWKILNTNLSGIKQKEIVMFSRQLALLLETGTDIVTAIDLLKDQVGDKTLSGILGEVVDSIRSGNSLSAAMSKHPKAFLNIYRKTIAAGEQGGNLETVLRQMADYLERQVETKKKLKNALTYPIVVSLVAVVVVAVIVLFVLPTFLNLYSSFGVEVPALLSVLQNTIEWLQNNLLILIAIIAALIFSFFLYIRTKSGRYRYDRLKLKLPVIGRVLQLVELAQASRTLSMLFRVGIPLPDILNMVIVGTENVFVSEAFEKVQHELIRGKGISTPMKNDSFFLPLMVQMVAVGEGTGNLDKTLSTVAESYEAEAAERTTAALGMIQPILTILIGLVVGFVAVIMVTAMYSMYGQM
jgi:type IV pilus assembly protein PilC